MQRLIIIIICGLYASTVFSLTQQTAGEQSLTIPSDSAADLLPSVHTENAPDVLSRLNFPLSGALEIRRRIWDKVSRCEVCHSLDLSFSNSYIPMLQGQKREYLYAKIKAFKAQRMSRHPFPDFTRSLSEDEVIDISLYYSIQNSLLDLKLVQLNAVSQPDAELAAVSITTCLDCHGRDGNGSGLIPDLSGQSRNYLSYRIREIAEGSSRIHLSSDAPVSCNINKVTIRQSQAMAAKLSLVIDSTRLRSGEQVYLANCQSCHEQGAQGAPPLDSQFDWMGKLLSGLNQYADYASRVPHREIFQLKHQLLSRNQWTDALHYVVSQSVHSTP